MKNKNTESIDLESISKSLPNYLDNEIIPTDIYTIDKILNGGIEIGSTIQLIGESGVGKSTTTLSIAKNLCAKGKNVVYIDTENSVSKETMIKIGLEEYIKEESRTFYYLRLSTFDEVEKKLDEFISTGDISLVILDSLPGLINKGYTNLKSGISITNPVSSYNSRALSMFMSKYKVLANQHKFSLLYTNQYRNKIDMTKGTIKKSYGGINVNHNSDVIIKINTSKDKDFNKLCEVYNDRFHKGKSGTLELVKSNKRSPINIPFYLIYGMGISNLCNYIYALQKLEIIKKAGSYYSIEFGSNTIKTNGLYKFLIEVRENGMHLCGIHKKSIDEFYDNLI